MPKGVDICGIIRCTVKNLKQSCINATYSGEYIFHIYRDKDDKEDNYFIDDRIFFIQSRDICINKIEMYDYNDNGSCKYEIIDTKLSPFLPCFTNKKCLQLTLDERNRKNIKKEDIDKTRTRELYINSLGDLNELNREVLGELNEINRKVGVDREVDKRADIKIAIKESIMDMKKNINKQRQK